MELGRVRGKFIVGLLLTFAAFATCIYVLLPFYFRSYLRARNYIWHWKHHDMARVGSYDVPVPSYWLVFNDEGNSLLLYDTRSKHRASVTISPARRVDMAVWKQLVSRPADSFQIKNSLEFTIGDEQVSCFEYLIAVKNTSFTAASCRAPSLDVIFSGNSERLPMFYEWVRTIRPVSPSH